MNYSTKSVSPKTIIMDFKNPIQKTYINKNNLKEIYIDKETRIKLGDEIPVDIALKSGNYKTFYKCNYMYKESSLSIRVNEFESTDASIYILPLLGIKKEYLLIESNFINCYIKHHKYKNEIGEYMYLIYRFVPAPYYSNFVNLMKKQHDCINYEREESDKRFDCFTFEVADRFKADIKLIFKGKFSKISEKAKQAILDFHKQNNSDTILSQILYKGELRRDELEEELGCIIPDNIDYAEKPNIRDNEWNYTK